MATAKGLNSLYESEHIGPDETGDNINAKRVALYSFDGTNWQRQSYNSTPYHLVSAGSTNATVVKASPGQLYGYMVSNTSAAYTYLCFHDTASTPTAGASILFKIGIPASGAANVSFPQGVKFATGIAITTVTGSADNNTTAVSSGDQVINLFYN